MNAAAANARISQLARDRAVHRAFGWLHLHEPTIRRWQTELLAIPAPTFAEGARALWFAERFRELGLGRVHVDAVGNALGEFPAPGSSGESAAPSVPTVLLSAHLDTVFPADTDCTPREEGARILAPGACDNAAGLAALLALAAALADAGLTPASPVLFAANVGEEGEGDLRGMRHLFTDSPYAPRLAAALALEGAGTATVVESGLGSRRLRVRLDGPGGHSWADAGRPHPILTLCSGLLAVDRLPLSTVARTTVNCGRIAGGTSVNSIPASATADLDLRSTSASELERTELKVIATLASAVDAANRERADGLHLGLRVERIGSRPAVPVPEPSAIGTMLRAVDRHLRLRTEPRVGSTDANLPLSLGVPALAIGAGGVGGGIHTLDEWFDPTGRELALRRILLLLLATCEHVAAEGLVDSPS